MLMVGVIVFGHFTNLRNIRRRLMVSRCRLLVLIADRHRSRVQILQRQAGNQHQQSQYFKKTFHAGILIVAGQAWQVHVKTDV